MAGLTIYTIGRTEEPRDVNRGIARGGARRLDNDGLAHDNHRTRGRVKQNSRQARQVEGVWKYLSTSVTGLYGALKRLFLGLAPVSTRFRLHEARQQASGDAHLRDVSRRVATRCEKIRSLLREPDALSASSGSLCSFVRRRFHVSSAFADPLPACAFGDLSPAGQGFHEVSPQHESPTVPNDPDDQLKLRIALVHRHQ